MHSKFSDLITVVFLNYFTLISHRKLVHFLKYFSLCDHGNYHHMFFLLLFSSNFGISAVFACDRLWTAGF